MPTKSSRRKNSVAVQYAVPRRGLPAAASFRRWAQAAGAGAARITFRVVGRAEGRRLNLRFRRMDRPTNVLSFSYDGQGDVVLCHPVVAREAREQGKRLRAHYAHLAVHGVLHLRGLDHEHEAGALRMERAEKRILRRLGLPDPYK